MPKTELTGKQIKDQSVDLSVDITGVLPVANGGSGSDTLPVNAVLLGNGVGAFQSVAPGLSGTVLTSNGTSWVAGTGVADVAAATVAAEAKTEPVDADTVPLLDSAASNVLKKLTWGNIKTALKSYYDSVTTTLTNKTISGANNTITNIAQASVTNLSTDLAGKEPVITAGTTGQYLRGDKSWQTLDKAAVGLSAVDDTSDVNKPVSTATQTALNGKQSTSEKGVANGYASLDASARVPVAQLPPGLAIDSVTRTDGYIQFYSGANAVGDPIYLDFDIIDGGTASSSSVNTFDGGSV